MIEILYSLYSFYVVKSAAKKAWDENRAFLMHPSCVKDMPERKIPVSRQLPIGAQRPDGIDRPGRTIANQSYFTFKNNGK